MRKLTMFVLAAVAAATVAIGALAAAPSASAQPLRGCVTVYYGPHLTPVIICIG